MAQPGAEHDQQGVCLCVVFNHPYTRNLPLLRRMYEGRFRTIRFLMPLQLCDDADVITVYRGSFSHNAYAVDAWPQLRELPCSHYLFVHDDVLLHPALDENNLLDTLEIETPREGYMPHLQRVPQDIGEWGHFAGPLWRLLHPRNFLSGTGVDSLSTVLAQLPPADAALKKLAPYGAKRETVVRRTEQSDQNPRGLKNFAFFGDRTVQQNDAFRRAYLEMLFAGDGEGESELVVPYPLLVSGPTADFCVVPKAGMPQYVHVSGVLAAAGLFVEVAAPTALALACDRVRSGRDTALRFIWELASVDAREVLHQMREDPDLVAAHPVKLSGVGDPEVFLADLEAVRSVSRPARVSMRQRVLQLAPDFDPEAYLDANPDVRAAGVSPWAHFHVHGHAEGRKIRAG